MDLAERSGSPGESLFAAWFLGMAVGAVSALIAVALHLAVVLFQTAFSNPPNMLILNHLVGVWDITNGCFVHLINLV